MIEATSGPDDDGATLVAIELPSGTGYALRTWHPDDGERLLTDSGRLVLFASADDAARHIGSRPERLESHDLVSVADTLGASHADTGPAAESGARLLLEADSAVQIGLTRLVGPGSAVWRVAAEAGRTRIRDSEPAVASSEGVLSQGLGGQYFALAGEARHDWLQALSVLEEHVSWVGDRTTPAVETGASALEDAVPGVEVLWIGADGLSGYTVSAWADPERELDVRFLGRPGEVVAWAELEQLSAYLRSDAPRMPGVDAWHRLADDEAVDLEPYEEAVVDLDELGDVLDERLSRADAARLQRGFDLIRDLARWTGSEDVLAELEPDRPLGRFAARDLPDLVEGSPRGRARLADTWFEPLVEQWRAAVALVAARIDWRGDGDESR